MDHVSQNNHTMSWEEARIIAKEGNWFRRGIREAICIRREEGHTINHDRGRHDLSNVYNPISKPTKHSTSERLHTVSRLMKWAVLHETFYEVRKIVDCDKMNDLI